MRQELTVESQKEKRCCICNELKQLSEFYKDSHLSSGLRPQCKKCVRLVVPIRRTKLQELERKNIKALCLIREKTNAKFKRCARCHILKPISEFTRHKKFLDGHACSCRQCHLLWRVKNYKRLYEYCKDWTKKHKKRISKYNYRLHRLNNDDIKTKNNTRSLSRYYVKTGKIIKQSCKYCGKPAQVHHPDYTKPLEIIWLCPSHHKQTHMGSLLDYNPKLSAIDSK